MSSDARSAPRLAAIAAQLERASSVASSRGTSSAAATARRREPVGAGGELEAPAPDRLELLEPVGELERRATVADRSCG